ncbi:MAG TPA: tRNA dimethylallyltransferase, partial [Thermomicrobiales bacterium]|nr:tRNA dimethylallyltransferase [Thermomicrobiales bacterium]
VNALVEGWRMPRVEPDPDVRSRLQREADEHGFEPLLARLREIDPASAMRTGPNVRRIIRALEVYEKTGQPMSEQQSKGPEPYDALELELWRPREELYRRIDDRVTEQVDAGLMDEIRALLAAGLSPEAGSFSSIGYRQAMPFIRGEATLDETMERIRFDTHRLVRHQETWWRKNPRLVRVDMTAPDAEARTTTLIEMHLATPSSRS